MLHVCIIQKSAKDYPDRNTSLIFSFEALLQPSFSFHSCPDLALLLPEQEGLLLFSISTPSTCLILTVSAHTLNTVKVSNSKQLPPLTVGTPKEASCFCSLSGAFRQFLFLFVQSLQFSCCCAVTVVSDSL